MKNGIWKSRLSLILLSALFVFGSAGVRADDDEPWDDEEPWEDPEPTEICAQQGHDWCFIMHYEPTCEDYGSDDWECSRCGEHEVR